MAAEPAAEAGPVAEAVFSEASAQPRTEGVPYAHLSLELGHLYAEDYEAGADALREQFGRVAPWVAAAVEACAAWLPAKRRPRVSTCFLVDDYFAPFGSPRTVIPQLVRAAEECGLRIDYLARESGCAEADGVDLAGLVHGRLVAEPTPHTTGGRPALPQTGWLSNGQRSPGSGPVAAMGSIQPWTPPAESAANRHSIFLDVELWSDLPGSGRLWSCPYLAAVWQLQRLGMLRDLGRWVAPPRSWDNDELPERWPQLPALLRLNPSAAPFCGYRTFSVLAGRYLPIEHAVRLILSQFAAEDEVAGQALERAATEGITLPPDLVERIGYTFLNR
jgi:hypothetical protein